ncbi:MAG: nitroreductase family protein [Anaerolineae bacterium]|nr:nitroreductase family protein [Anaerolineae bacterium]
MTRDARAWFMYVVRCADGTLYTGIATDVMRRVKAHNAGRGARYTQARRPVTLVAVWRFGSPGAHVQALKAEQRFKSLPRTRKQAIIAVGSDWGSGARIAGEEWSSMNKEADTQYPIHDLLKRRWSPRAFADKSIAQETLLSLLEAARWAPSARNAQPWAFIVGLAGTETHQKLCGCLTGDNPLWACDAPVLVLAVARLEHRPGRENRYALHDTGMAVLSMVIQAMAFDIYAHQMGGFDKEKARAVFQIPEDCAPVTVIALGYLGDPDDLPAGNLHERERQKRTRKPLSEFVFGEAWGAIWPPAGEQGGES